MIGVGRIRGGATGFVKQLQEISRLRKLGYFMKAFRPGPGSKVLAVGVDPTGLHSFSNLVEYSYPYLESMVGLTNDLPDRWSKTDSPIRMVCGDGLRLPFRDNSFDICMSNAVVEHVGTREEQRMFVEELCRVAPKVFVTTPNFFLPFELHTRLPLVHFLPGALRDAVLRRTGRQFWADNWGRRLNLLTARQLRRLFPDWMDARVFGNRVTLMSESLVAIARRKDA